jgi:UDP-glucuronate decarboxylase
MKRILVTGGAGFLGSHLCTRLIERGFFVTCLDNYFTGAVDNIAHLRGNPNFAMIEQSVIDPVDVKFDEIFNLACPASPVHYQSDPIYTFKTSIIGTMNLLELASKTGAKVLQASTSEIYGDPLIHPQKESYWGNVNTMGIRSCYDEGKRGAETLMYDYHRTRGVNIRVMRIFNTFGPGMNQADGRVVSNFIVQALKGHDITIFGDGNQTRSFCYRDDLIEGMMRLMDAPDAVSYPINIGNPGEFTMKELADIVLELTGSKSKMVYKPLPQDDPLQRCPDISKAKDILDWEPKIPLREGLVRTIEYFKTVI